MSAEKNCPHCSERKKKRSPEEQKALLTRLRLVAWDGFKGKHLKNVHVKAIGAEQNDGYKYPHSYKDAWVEQSYLRIPERYYLPSDQGYEATIAKRMAALGHP